MNFLAEVLSSAETIEISEINEKVPILKQTVDKLKIDIIEYTENVYIKYANRARNDVNANLLKEVRDVGEEIKKLSKIFQSATKNVSKGNKFTEQGRILNTIDFTVNVLYNVCKINEKLNKFTLLMNDNRFYDCRKIIDEMECIIMEIPDDEDLLVIDQHRFNITDKYSLLLDKMRQCFQEKVVTVKEEKLATIKISKDIHPLDEALLAMFYKQSSKVILNDFVGFLWKNFFVPIVDNVVEVTVDTNDIFSTLNLSIIDLNKKCSYNEVFSQLILVLEFIKTNFNFPLTDLKDSLTTLQYIGSDMQDNLSKLIINHCLVDTIPSTVEGLQNYKSVIQETDKLESVLRETPIFSPQTASLIEYANNIEFHYINKKCRNYFLQSQQIMKKNLHDFVEVGQHYDPENLDGDFEYFPQCSVSKSVIELLDYSEKLLQKAVKASNMCTCKLVMTCRSILSSYAHLVPEYHSELLKTIPQQVALFHNNCFYISHNLSKWNGTYILKIPSKLNISNIRFDMEVSKLRLVGSETFSAHNKRQIKKIGEIMKSSGLSGIALEGELKVETEECVQQCLRQQELLKTVWHKVLPYRIYNESLGVLLNTLCSCLITSVINFQGISSKSAEQLVEIIKMITNRGPKLFDDPKKVNSYVKSWYKLTELSFVLGASLVDINDRWADGKGPLALWFKPVELKSLIKALFPNSSAKSAILIKI